MRPRLNVGDLVRIHDPNDTDRQIGIIVALSPRQVHLASHGTTDIVQVFWPKINDTDWEYDFFLIKIEE
jgi:hypothetical protein